MKPYINPFRHMYRHLIKSRTNSFWLPVNTNYSCLKSKVANLPCKRQLTNMLEIPFNFHLYERCIVCIYKVTTGLFFFPLEYFKKKFSFKNWHIKKKTGINKLTIIPCEENFLIFLSSIIIIILNIVMT